MRWAAGVLALAATCAHAADLHVDAVLGDDGNDGLSWTAPKRTIGAAIIVAELTPETDTVRVAEGRYAERLTVRTPVDLEGGYERGGASRDWMRHRSLIDGPRADIPSWATVHFDTGSGGTLRGFVISGEAPALHVGVPATVADNVIQGIEWTARATAMSFVTVSTWDAACPVFDRNVIIDADATLLFSLYPNDWVAPLEINGAEAANCELNNIQVLQTRDDPDARVWQPDIVVHRLQEHGTSAVTLRNVRARRLVAQGTVTLANVDLDDLRLTCFSTLDASNVTAERVIYHAGDVGSAGPQVFSDSILATSRWPDAVPSRCPPALPTVTNSIVPDDRGEPGTIVADPLLVGGPASEHYLSSVAAGQSADSPAIDRGSRDIAAAGLATRTTRTDGEPDTGTVDLGYHPPSNVEMPELYVQSILRGTSPTTLAPIATSPLPWTDAPGTASDPALPLLFYSVDPWLNVIDVTLDGAIDAPRVSWHGP